MDDEDDWDEYEALREAEVLAEHRLDNFFYFFGKVEEQRAADPEGCWNWPAAITSTTGYGRVRIDGVQIDSHRASWAFMRGAIPREMDVCHHCDNRACVNPKHLFLGTRSDNMVDARNKGRIAGQKLQLGDVRRIRALLASGLTHKTIAERYGVHRTTISSIARGDCWKES